jgi:hypothetical protein
MVHSYKQHRFPADFYGSPTVCECGVTYEEFVRMDAPKEAVEKGEKRCKKYSGVAIDSFSTPRWNQGLGCFTSSVRETERIAKSKGLEPIGSAKMEEVFKPKRDTTSRELAHQMIKEFRSEHRRVVV